MTRRAKAVVAAAAAAASLSCGPAPDPAVRVVDLGCHWRMRAAEDTVWVPATVPGTVQTDLLAAGRIPDPFTGDHEVELDWIENEDWIYRCDFDVDSLTLEEDRVDLVFEGLDTYADVTLDSVVVLRADNQFRTWRVDVRDVLRAGSNTLLVRFGDAVLAGQARAHDDPWPIPHQEPDESRTRAFTRKAAYQYGWDWGPRYVTSGIWRPIRLEAWSGARIVDAWAGPPTWVGDTARVPVNVTLEANRRGSLRLGFHSPDGSFASVVRDVPAPPPGGSPQVETILSIPAAEAWWPRGMSEPVGRLYDVQIDLAQGRSWDRATRRIGLRTVRLVMEPDSVGESFRFEVNERPLFARGANLVPPDHFTPRADSATYARILDDAVRANMNMLRVWGGGIYLPDVFYDLADARGVLVWQDFMFANTLVPGDPAFARSVEAEATDQVRRLRRHPSLALWCGNNEIAEGWANWSWREEYDSATANLVDAAYHRIFQDILPSVVGAEDPAASYIPSSPRFGWGHRESLTEGDSHYWGVWWGMEPFRAYAEKIPRFASEFGFQALPAPATLAAFGDPPPTGLGDPVMRTHEKHPTGFPTIRAYLERAWPVPADDSLDAWSYVTQLAQAEGVGLALEAHRRSWPRTGGTLFWQLNDTWPVVSWSSIDFFGRWKALQYEARRVFAPVAVLADRWADTLAVWVAADTAVAGTLRVRVLDFDGGEIARRQVPVRGAGLAWRGTRSSLLPAGVDPRRVVALAELESTGGVDARTLAKDRAFFVDPKDLSLPDPALRLVSAEPDGDAWTVAVTATRFAYAVRLTVDGVGARYSENFVDLLPGDTVRVRAQTEAPTPDLAARVRLRSLGDRAGR